MSLYNRESVVRRHNGVFNRAHHPVKEVDESTLESSQLEDARTRDNKTQEAAGNKLTTTSSSTVSLAPSPTINLDTLSSSLSSATTSSSLHPSSLESAVPKPVITPSSPPGSGSAVDAVSSQAPVVTSSKGGLSSGAIGAIVTLVILLVAVIAALAIRKFYIHRREFKRNTWGAGLVPALQTKRNTIYGDEKKAGPPSMEQREKSAPSLLTAPGFPSSPKLPLPPPSSYNSAPSPTSAVSPVQATSPSRSATQKADVAVVVRTFIPSLPDELNITTGEHIRILTRYDDGWALCSNIRNEQGVVPLECLQRADTTAALQLQPQSEFGYGSDKSTKRLSSLAPNNDGTY